MATAKKGAGKREGKKARKGSARPVRKPKPAPERSAPALASELGLTCRQLRQTRPGRFESCRNPATCFIVGAGDSCDRCARGRRMIRYATARRPSARVAA